MSIQAQNNLTVLHTTGSYMVRSNPSVVAISINGFYLGWFFHHGGINNRELSLARYVHGKNILRKSSIQESILPWTLLSMKYFLSIISKLWYITGIQICASTYHIVTIHIVVYTCTKYNIKVNKLFKTKILNLKRSKDW